MIVSIIFVANARQVWSAKDKIPGRSRLVVMRYQSLARDAKDSASRIHFGIKGQMNTARAVVPERVTPARRNYFFSNYDAYDDVHLTFHTIP